MYSTESSRIFQINLKMVKLCTYLVFHCIWTNFFFYQFHHRCNKIIYILSTRWSQSGFTHTCIAHRQTTYVFFTQLAIMFSWSQQLFFSTISLFLLFKLFRFFFYFLFANLIMQIGVCRNYCSYQCLCRLNANDHINKFVFPSNQSVYMSAMTLIESDLLTRA